MNLFLICVADSFKNLVYDAIEFWNKSLKLIILCMIFMIQLMPLVYKHDY